MANKEREYRKFEQSVERIRLKQLADAQVAQFFIAKTDATKDFLLTDADYRKLLRHVNKGMGPLQSQKLSYVETLLSQYRFFHWFLEFPEVLDEGGFDCVLGNPPFQGGKRISGTNGDRYLLFIKTNFYPANGSVDLVTFFLRRIFHVLKLKGILSLITTNTIAQGDSRIAGIDHIVGKKGEIIFAVKSQKWPGNAAVEISLITIKKGGSQRKRYLNNKEVGEINSYLDSDLQESPKQLAANKGQAYMGSIPLGMGFVLTQDEASDLISTRSNNSRIIFPYLNGEDLNNNVHQVSERWIINFSDWQESYCKENFPECYRIVEEKVKPERMLLKDKGYREKWWQFGRRGVELYKSIQSLSKIIVVARTSKTLAFTRVDSAQVLNANLTVLSLDRYSHLSLLQSSIHNAWAWKYATRLKTDLIYQPTDLFETFPFPQNITIQQERQMETIGEAYHEHRKQLMLGIQLGLTKSYNLFHSNAITVKNIQEKDKQVAALQKHLNNTSNTISFDEAIQGILKFRELHVQMDAAVLNAYGWNDIQLRHDFYEVDYLPENDRIRFTIHPDARKEVLKRLLALNHQIHTKEVALTEASKLLEPKKRRTGKNEKIKQQLSLISMRPETAFAPIYSVQDIARVTKLSAQRIKRWLNKLLAGGYEGFAKEGDRQEDRMLVNFYEMHELIVIYDLRIINKIPLQDILDARTWLKQRFGGNKQEFYPFTQKQVLDVISKAGKQIIFTDDHTGDQITLGKGNSQLNFAFIKDFLKRIVFDNEMVSRLYLSNSQLLAIDPNLAGGRPCTVENEILIDSIKSAFLDCNDVSYVAKTYEISEELVNEALQFDRASVLN